MNLQRPGSRVVGMETLGSGETCWLTICGPASRTEPAEAGFAHGRRVLQRPGESSRDEDLGTAERTDRWRPETTHRPILVPRRHGTRHRHVRPGAPGVVVGTVTGLLRRYAVRDRCGQAHANGSVVGGLVSARLLLGAESTVGSVPSEFLGDALYGGPAGVAGAPTLFLRPTVRALHGLPAPPRPDPGRCFPPRSATTRARHRRPRGRRCSYVPQADRRTW